MNRLYYSLRKGLNTKGKMIDYEVDPQEIIGDRTTDWYSSLYYYNDEQKKLIDSRGGSVAGIDEVITDKLLFDFDSKEYVELALNDAYNLYGRLVNQYKFNKNSIVVHFSGAKGFSVEVFLDRFISVQEFKWLAFYLAKDLPTFDKVVNNASRVIRVPNTKHQTSGLYKVPISAKELNSITLADIFKLAETPRQWEYDIEAGSISKDLLDLIKLEPKKEKKEPYNILMDNNKPTFLTNCRWALQNGLFKDGERNHALLCLAATYKNMGYDLEINYRMLKGVSELQSKHSGGDRFPEEELYNNIIMQVYSNSWKNGQFSCKDKHSWLHSYCEALGDKSCNKNVDNKDTSIELTSVFGLFENYVSNYEKNVLYTGIPSLDKRAKLLVGTSNALVASPGVGKTSLALQILNHNSLKDVPSIFFSYDMFHSALVSRMIQKHTGLPLDDVYDTFLKSPKKADQIKEMLKKEYKNVRFCFKSGQSCDELQDTILETEDKIGDKVKLVIVDYNELLIAKHSDPTSASGEVAQRLRQIANDKQVCVLTLLQPSKLFSTPGDEVTNYNAAKGSSAIVQSLTLMLGAARPGFNPTNPDEDRYFNITCLKNRNGPLFSLDFSWDGLTGKIDELEDYQRNELFKIREIKKAEKELNKGW